MGVLCPAFSRAVSPCHARTSKKIEKNVEKGGIFFYLCRITSRRDGETEARVNTDEQIAEAVKGGGREGQRLMVSRYGQVVFAMIVQQVPSMMDAEELTQDTFLRAFSHIGSYNPRRASLATWLCRIAYRLTLDFLKHRQPLIIPIDDAAWETDISDEQLETELSTGREERIQQLELLMDDLPPDERLLLTLHYFESRSLDECAFIMDATPHALSNRLYRIRKKLHKELQKI